MKIVLQLIGTYLLTVLVIAFAAGILVSSQLELSLIVVFVTALLAGGALCFSSLRPLNGAGCSAAMLLFFLAGLYAGTSSSRQPPEPHHIYNLVDRQRDIVAVGRLRTMPSFDGATSQALIRLESVRLGADSPHVPARGNILLRLPGPWPHGYRPGDLLAVRATAQRPSTFSVPGVFDYPAELARQDIWVTGYSRSPAHLHKVIDRGGTWQRARYLPEILRTAVGEFLDHHTAPDVAAFYRAIILGDRSRLSDETLERFKASGTMHILAMLCF